MRLPVVATGITGLKDTVVNGETGILVPPGTITELVAALEELISNEQKRKTLGEAGRRYALEKFQQEPFWKDLEAFYERNIGSNHAVRIS